MLHGLRKNKQMDFAKVFVAALDPAALDLLGTLSPFFEPFGE